MGLTDLGLPPADIAILRVSQRLGIESIKTGDFHKDIYETAKAYAEVQAINGRQDGHAGWDRRYTALRRIAPSHPLLFEVTAESWDLVHQPEALQQYQQYGASPESEGIGPIGFYSSDGDETTVLENIASSLFDSWRQSSGHWEIVNNRCTYFGYAVAEGRRCYYGVGIVAK